LWAQDTAQYSVRFVTHCDVNEEQIEQALVVLREAAAKPQGVGA
jgi:threonine aldolase